MIILFLFSIDQVGEIRSRFEKGRIAFTKSISSCGKSPLYNKSNFFNLDIDNLDNLELTDISLF